MKFSKEKDILEMLWIEKAKVKVFDKISENVIIYIYIIYMFPDKQDFKINYIYLTYIYLFNFKLGLINIEIRIINFKMVLIKFKLGLFSFKFIYINFILSLTNRNITSNVDLLLLLFLLALGELNPFYPSFKFIFDY